MFDSFDVNDIELVVQEYKNTIFRIAFHYTKNRMDAEDVTQEVFMKWVNKKPCFDTKEHEKAWFIRITINLCKDKLRFEKSRQTSSLDDVASHNNLASTEILSDSDMLELVIQLPEKYRMVIYLHYYEGYSLNEIAKILKKSPNTIQTWHERAKKKLRIMIGDADNELGTISQSP